MKHSHVHFAASVARAVTASAQRAVCAIVDQECSAADSVRCVENPSVFEQTVFTVGVVTTLTVLMYGLQSIASYVRRPYRRTGPNHNSFIGDADEYREHLCEYGHGPFR